MISKIRQFAEKYKMFDTGDTVVCGLSGGADSVCLLLSLCSLSESMRFSVEAVHVNHCLRGDESDRDEAFCRDLCERLNVPFTAVSCNVMDYSEKNSLSTEEAARILRYQIFEDNSKGKKIATAHNANDNLETVIFNLTRGTALKGLTGIPPLRGNIVRPLLSVTRKEIEEFLFKAGQNYVTDSTNLTEDYTRNKIRHLVMPVLQEINSSAVETSVRTIDALRSENSMIQNESESALKKCRAGNRLTGLSEYHEVIRKRCITALLTENNLSYSYERLKDIDRIVIFGGKINVSEDIYIVSDGNTTELKEIKQMKSPETVCSELVLGENSIFEGKILICEKIKCDNLKKIRAVHKNLTFYLIDYDKIKGRAVLRNRKYGDRIQLKGRNFNSSVKKLINAEISPDERECIHFIEDEEGTIFAEKLGIAERVAPDENTVTLLKITVK